MFCDQGILVVEKGEQVSLKCLVQTAIRAQTIDDLGRFVVQFEDGQPKQLSETELIEELNQIARATERGVWRKPTPDAS